MAKGIGVVLGVALRSALAVGRGGVGGRWHGIAVSLKELARRPALRVFLLFSALGSLGYLTAVVYRSFGPAVVLLLWIPLLLARFSYQQYINLRAAHLETVLALATAVDARDPNTRGHSERVSRYAVEIARELKLCDAELEKLRYAGILHDIGKIGISDAVLNKVGPLTDREFALVKSHTVMGARMVEPVGFLKGAADVIRHHHERYDGRGYPDGLAGEEIPLGARILAVADAFDAMTYDRVYRAAMDPDRAVEELLINRGAQFDPNIVDVFVNKVLPRHPELWRNAAARRYRESNPASGGGRPKHTAGEAAAAEDRRRTRGRLRRQAHRLAAASYTGGAAAQVAAGGDEGDGQTSCKAAGDS